MEAFFIFYGLIEASNSIYVYKGKNKYNLYVTLVWGLAFILVGLVEILNSSLFYKDVAYSIFGLSWFPMMFTPCSAKIFRVNQTAKLIRKIIFVVIGVYQFWLLS